MKKVLICSALAIGLLVFGTSQNNTEAAQPEAIISLTAISSMDIETALIDVQSQKLKLLDSQIQAEIAKLESSNVQQVDMLRIQNLIVQRALVADIMSNTHKQMPDYLKSIIENKR